LKIFEWHKKYPLRVAVITTDIAVEFINPKQKNLKERTQYFFLPETCKHFFPRIFEHVDFLLFWSKKGVSTPLSLDL